ncbi:Hydantoin racemase [Comamonas testosteroni]|nr:Hydantoin racemase [Comamonas testosteroni]
MQDDHAARLQALCEAAVSEDGADVLIIAGAPLAGLARSIKQSLPVPAVDGVSSAVNHAQSLVSLAPSPARAGSFAKPPRKDFKNLPSGLTQLLSQLP